MASLYGRQTVSTSSKILNPSTDPTAFTRSYEVERKTVSSGIGSSKYEESKEIIPVTKVEIVPSDSTSAPKHIYVNVSLLNDIVGKIIPAQFQIDFDQPFLKDAEKYYLTIAKASFPTTTIPLFKFDPVKYSLGIRWRTFAETTILGPIGIPQSADGFCYVYYYQQFIDSVNYALRSTFARLKRAQPTFPGTIPPYIRYDKPSNRFSLIAQQGVWSNDTSDHGDILFSYSLFRLFNSTPSYSAGLSGQLLVMNVESTNSSSIIDSTSVNPTFYGDMYNTIDRNFSLYDPLFAGSGKWYYPGDLVIYSNSGVLTYYACLQTNYGLSPILNPLSWVSQGAVVNGTEPPSIWNATASYAINQIVYYTATGFGKGNSVPFISLQSSNLNNAPDPTIATAFWLPLNSGNPTIWNNTSTYEVGQNVYYPTISSGAIYTCLVGNSASLPTTTTNWAPATQFLSYNIMGEYSTLSTWSDFQSIVIQTAALPIRFEAYSPPSANVESGSVSSQSASQVPRPVLTDLDLIKTADGFDRSPLQYVPPGNYRMVDMFAKPELRQVDAYVQYMHQDLSFSDLMMLPGDSFRIKYLFIRNDALSLS